MTKHQKEIVDVFTMGLGIAAALQLPENQNIDDVIKRAEDFAGKFKHKILELIPEEHRFNDEERREQLGWLDFKKIKPVLNDHYTRQIIVRLEKTPWFQRFAEYNDDGTVTIDNIDVTSEVQFYALPMSME